jgi:hypothetical protein
LARHFPVLALATYEINLNNVLSFQFSIIRKILV